jgi:hypothetical protein
MTISFSPSLSDTHRALDTLKVDAAQVGRRNRHRNSGIPHRAMPRLFEIGLPRAWHWLAILVGLVIPLQ